MSTSPPDLTKDAGAAADAGADFVDVRWLLRSVNLRRALKVLIGLELFAFVLWLGYCGLVQSSFQKESEVWFRIDDQIAPGLVTLSIVLAATVVVLVLLGLPKRQPFAIARTLVPIIGRGPKVSLQRDKGGVGTAVLARLRRRGFAQPVALVTFILFAPIAVTTAAEAWPTWQANHGNGGRTFEITGSTTVTEETNSTPNGRGGLTESSTFTVGTPDGTALAESGRPETGERWLVKHDVFGNLRAYRIGAHDYLLVGLLFLLSTAAAGAALAYQGESIRRERRRRRAAGEAGDLRTLASDLDRLANGARPELMIAGKSGGLLGAPVALASRDPWPALVARKTGAGVLAVGAVVVLVGAFAVQQTNLIGAPPLYRGVVLPYLTDAGYEPEADIGYQTAFEERSLRTWTGAGVSEARQIDIEQSRRADGPRPQPVDLLLARTRADGAATTGRWERDLAGNGVIPVDVTEVTGLPSGWSGRWVVTRYRTSSDSELRVLTVRDGLLLEVTIKAEYLSSDYERTDYPQATLAAWAARLATTLDRAGLSRLEADTARPASA